MQNPSEMTNNIAKSFIFREEHICIYATHCVEFNMALEKIVEKIPSSKWMATSERLIDIVLNSANSNKMPSGLAKTILYYWQRDQLATKIGIQRLLEASLVIDPEKTTEVLNEFDLQEAVAVLGSR
jgi:hypothetical protein